jgi:NAD binding domain of 6-phosphogluconate dehydrogenase
MAELLRPALHDAVPYSRPGTPSIPPQIGFVGLGAMGFLIARNLARYRASHVHGSPPLLVWNRSVDKSAKLVEVVGSGKVRIANDPEQVALECDVIITSLGSDAVVKSIYERFKAVLAVFHTTITIMPEVEVILEYTCSTQNLCRNQHGPSITSYPDSLIYNFFFQIYPSFAGKFS